MEGLSRLVSLRLGLEDVPFGSLGLNGSLRVKLVRELNVICGDLARGLVGSQFLRRSLGAWSGAGGQALMATAWVFLRVHQ